MYAPELGIEGFFRIVSDAPAHGPGGPASPDADLQLMPHIGWANAIPDGCAEAAFTINGSLFTLSGRGYHDKNWGDQVFSDSVGSWYWGHARLGKYSIVWFDALDQTGHRYTSSYVASNGKILVASHDGGDIHLRPFGAGTSYPPHISDNSPEGFHIIMSVPDLGTINATVTTDQSILGAFPRSPYRRWAGRITGTVEVGTVEAGKEVISGVTSFEQFTFDP